jgi:hypothetical protein
MTVRDFLDRSDNEPQSMQNTEKTELKETAEVLHKLINGEIDIKELTKEIESLKHKRHIEDVAYM